MKEVKLKKNSSNLKIFINDFPNLFLIPKDELDLIIVTIELQVAEYFNNKRTCFVKKE